MDKENEHNDKFYELEDSDCDSKEQLVSKNKMLNK